MNELNLNQLAGMLSQFTGNYTGQIRPERKPHYVDTPPAWKASLTLGTSFSDDPRKHSLIKCYIKPPTFQFPNSALFLQMISGGKAAYMRISSKEFKALSTSLNLWLPQIESKLEELKALEAQQIAAKAVYQNMINSGEEEQDG